MDADVPWNCGGGYVDIWISWRDETLESECPGFMKDEYVAVEQNSNKMNSECDRRHIQQIIAILNNIYHNYYKIHYRKM